MTTHLRTEDADTADPGEASGSRRARGTGSTTTLVLGVVILVGLALWIFLGLVATPADKVQDQAVRLIYVHVPVVTVAYVGCFLCAIASGMWLWKRSQWWDLVASSAAELATLFTALTLVSGSIWGGTAWGTFWEWDARLTSTALLFLLLLGYQAIRRIPATTEVRGKRSAIVGLLLVPNIIIVNRSVEWWRSLHQDPTIFKADVTKPEIHDLMYFTLSYALVLGLVVFVWLMIHRFRVGYLQDQVDELGLEHAIAERRAEGGPNPTGPRPAGALGIGFVTTAIFAETKPYQIPNAWNYVFAGWTIVLVGVGLYTLLLLRRGRHLAVQLDEKDRRWMS